MIEDMYVAILKFHDPDYIYYTNDVDPEIIKKLKIFNSCGYFNIDEQPIKEDISGVHTFYLLSRFAPNQKVFVPGDDLKAQSILLDYYKINFGFEPNANWMDNELTKNRPYTIINADNFDNLNQFIHQEKPINKALLSRVKASTHMLRSSSFAKWSDFEIVVAKDKSSINDLIYFWNRLLFECSNILYVTVDELNVLSQDRFFGSVLYDLNIESTIHVVSTTLTKEEVNELIELKLNPIAFNRSFQYKELKESFFHFSDVQQVNKREHGESLTTQAIVSEKGLIQIPKLSFATKEGYYPMNWALDVEIRRFGDENLSILKFPFTTDTQHVIKGTKGRINTARNITLIINKQRDYVDTLKISIPSFDKLLHQLISFPVINGEMINTKYVDIRPHDASNKLTAFLKSFNFDFGTIDEIFSDKFWVDLFEELILSGKVVGDTISFERVLEKALFTFEENRISLGEKGETYLNKENLELGLKKTLNELCGYRVFFKGFNIKCLKCSSEFWYSIKEVGEIVNCKGCLEDFELPIEPKFAYKLSDIIKNNIYQTKTSRDGNFTVIRTLSGSYRVNGKSFEYSPQLNLYDSSHASKPCSELDIIWLEYGLLVIGEAKHNGNAFFADSTKSLKSLVEISKAIRPDKVVLSCYEDPKGKLENARKSLVHLFDGWEYQPEIVTILLDKPDYFNLGNYRYFYH